MRRIQQSILTSVEASLCDWHRGSQDAFIWAPTTTCRYEGMVRSVKTMLPYFNFLLLHNALPPKTQTKCFNHNP
jgi:hypothetical protein